MAKDGKIYITISNKMTEAPDTSQVVETKQEKNDSASAIALAMFTNFMESEVKQLINYSLGNIGNFTGDYTSQRTINETLSMLNVAKNIGLSTFAGAKVGGVGGAIVGLVASVGSQITNFALAEHSNKFQIKQQQYETQRLRELSGLDNLTNGGRI